MLDPGARYESSLSRAARRARGTFFTPRPLAEEVVRETLAPLLSRPGARLRILDPAAGAGQFLLVARDLLFGQAELVGIERDPAAAAIARAELGSSADIRVADALADASLDGQFDAVIGNPPYVRSVALRREDPALWAWLRGRYAATSHGEWDLYGAFIERALSWAAPGGEIGLVVPSRWLTAAFAARLRGYLGRQRAVRKVVDFGATQLFPGATTYVSLLYMSRTPSSMVHVRRLSTSWEEGHIPAQSLDSAPWTLEVGRAAAELPRLREAGPPLGVIARIAKGAGTNADPVFLLTPTPRGHHSAALDEEVDLEPDLLVPCLRGRDVQPFAAPIARVALLPYRPDGTFVSSLPEKTAAYLARCRAILERREGGRFQGADAHRWGRPQNLAWLRDPTPKLVVPDAARRGRAALDDRGTLVIDTAYAVRPHDPAQVPIGLLLAVLSSPVVATWLRATGIPLRGGFFRMKTAYLASLPIPDPSTAAARRVAETALGVHPDDTEAQHRLDHDVLRLYGIA